MTRTDTTRRTYLLGAAATAGMFGVAGCLGTSTGSLATRVTDQPGDIDDFESCIVTLAGIWIGPSAADTAGTATAGSTEREYHEFDDPVDADLVELTDGTSALVDERSIETGEYAFLQVDVTSVDATLNGGESADVSVPGEAPLTFNRPFEIREDTRTVFTADVTPVQQGQSDGYVLQPVPSGIAVSYEE